MEGNINDEYGNRFYNILNVILTVKLKTKYKEMPKDLLRNIWLTISSSVLDALDFLTVRPPSKQDTQTSN